MATVQSNRSPRSLADDLRSRTPGQIRSLLSARPDLLNPWPTDVSQLARRAADDASVLEAMGALDTRSLRVLEVFAALHEAPADTLSAALGEDVDDVIAGLWERALLWGGPIFKIVRAAQQAFGPYPCGLSAASHLTPDAKEVADAAQNLDADRLRYLVWEHPVSTAANPLTVLRGEQHVVPREVALVLREGKFLPPASPPELPEPAVAPASAVWNTLAGVRYVLTDLDHNPLPFSAAKSVTRRAVQDRAQAMGVPHDDLVVWLELAALAGLVGPVDGSVHPTRGASAWLSSAPQDMWVQLIDAWLDSDRILVRCRADELGTLTTSGQPRVAHHRRQILACWPAARLSAEQAREWVAWQRPRLVEAVALVGDVMAELTALGLLVGGVPVSEIGRPRDVVVPGNDNGLIVQPDHTVIAPANVDTPTWQLLYEIARVESWGPVTMHRIELPRLRAAMSTRDPSSIVAALATASRTPLPQSLEYTVGDAARGTPVQVSRMTVIRAHHADAEAVRALGWQELVPGTFATADPADSVRRQLDDAGIAMVQADSSVSASPLEYPRASSHDAAAVDRLVGHLVEETAVPAEAPALEPADPATLRQALTADCVWLEFTEGTQALTHLVEPLEVRSGSLTAWSLTAARTVTVPLSRIAALRIVND